MKTFKHLFTALLLLCGMTASANSTTSTASSSTQQGESETYTVTYLVDGNEYASYALPQGASIPTPEAPAKEGYTFIGWDSDEVISVVTQTNANEMLYTNAPCTNTQWGDEFKGWDMLFDNDANTFFHSEYGGTQTADGLDHYIRVDMGEGNDIGVFKFTYTNRSDNGTNAMGVAPKKIIVEGSNSADGTYTTITTVTGLSDSGSYVYTSGQLGSNDTRYRYIRFRVTKTYGNNLDNGHPFFAISEFGMNVSLLDSQTMPARDITFQAVFEAPVTTDELLFEIISESEKTARVIRKENNEPYTNETITIPATIERNGSVYQVTEIGNKAFYHSTNLESITIPNTITNIGTAAFYGCSGLTSIKIPNSVTSIGTGAFDGCSGLTSVTIPNSVTSIGGWEFRGCTGLTSIIVEEGNPKYDSRDNCNAIIETATNTLLAGCNNTVIPNGIVCIAGNALSDLPGITEVRIPQSVEKIESRAFTNCPNLESIVVENGNTKYDSRNNCNAIIETDSNTLLFGCSNTTFPEDILRIESSAFSGSGIKTAVIPEGVKSIGYGAFNSSAVTSITIPNSVVGVIEDWSFNNCPQLESLTIGDGITAIGEYAFYECRKLRNVTIGRGIKSIGNNAFYGCGVTDLTVNAPVAPRLGKDVFFDDYSYFEPSKANLTFPEGANYFNADWMRYCTYANMDHYFWGDVEWFEDDKGNAFAYGHNNAALTSCPNNIKKLYIDGSISTIESEVCYWMESLEEVHINSTVSCSIGERAFEHCTNLKSVHMSGSITSIGDYAFNECELLKKIYFSESLTSIGNYAFYNCGSLKNPFLPKSLNTIGNYAFYGATTDFTVIPQFVTSIGNYAFSNGIIVFKSFVAPYMGDFEYGVDVCIPAGANSYPSNKFSNIYIYESQRECWFNWERELFVFGNADLVGNDSRINGYDVKEGKKITFTPDATGYNLVTILPNIKEVDVLTYKMEDRNLYTIEGSNAVFKYYEDEPDETILVAGCAATVIPEGTTRIDNNAFNGCIGLTDINIPSSVRLIGESAFKGCIDLKNVNISSGYKNFERFAFNGCEALEAVHIDDIKSWCNNDFYEYEYDSNPLFYAGNLYLNGNLITDLVIPNDVTEIHGCAFLGATGFASVEIPGNVKSIGRGAFQNCSNIKNVKMHDGVNSIGISAFSNCTSITEIEIPSCVTNVGNTAFAGCTGLKKATINNNSISYWEFGNCTSLETLEISKKTELIDSYAFNGCTSLANITIDEANGVYDQREDCDAIIETASNKLIYLCKNSFIPSTVTAIGGNSMNAFTDMDITVPAFVTSIDDNAFNGVNRTHFESVTPASINGNIFGWGAIYVPSAAYEKYCNANVWSDYKHRIVTTEIADKYVECYSKEGRSGVLDAIGLNEVDKVVKLKVKGEINSYDITVFRDKMPLLSQLDLSEATVIASSKPFYQTYCTGNNSLGGYAFYDLDKLASVKLPKGLKTLGDNAFKGCNNLMSVNAEATDELNIGNNAFYGCNKLKDFVSPAKISEVGEYAFYKCDKLESIELRDISGSIGRYAFAECGKLITGDIESVGGNISSHAFENCKNIKTINIDVVGGNIEEFVFKNSKIEEVRIGTMTGNLGNSAFGRCSSLKNVTFDKGPAKIGERVFEYSDELERVVAGDGLLEICKEAFVAYALKKEVSNSIYGTSVNYTEESVDRQNLKTVVLPNSVQSIGKSAFYKCVSLCDFIMPQGVTSIESSAFSTCNSLQEINIPGGVTKIQSSAFSSCKSLKDVNISNGVKEVGNYAFSGCTSLENVNIPGSVTQIDDNAFINCNHLKNVTFSNGLASIGKSAFSYCGFENIKMPPTLKTIDDNAFYACLNLTELHIPSSVESIGEQAFAGANQLNDIYTYTVEPTVITESTFSTFATASLHVPETSFWNYYWNIGWSRFDHKKFVDFNEVYEYFYLNNDYYLDNSTGYIEGTPDADLHPGSGLIVEGEENNEDIKQNLGDVSLESDGEGNSASIIGDNSLYIENLNVKINIKGGRWYFFAFPWDVKRDRISMENGSDYVFRYYDGEERAKNGNGGWKNVNEPHLKAARGYIFQSSGDDVLVISIENVKFKKEDKYNELVTHVSENLNDASWNLMGNPYLSYYDLADMDYTAPVTVWDGEKYVAIRPGDDDYQFAPYEAFFVQKPEGEESVTFAADGQMTKTQAETDMLQKAAARRVRGINPQRLLVNLVLGNDVTEDRTRVVFNERQTHNYETACDAAKFMTAGVPQLYTIDDEGVHYAINERPKGNGVVFMGYTAPTPGYYTIDAPRMDAQVFLYDAETEEIHYFEDGAYRFISEAGTFEKRFSLGIRDDEATGIEEVKGENGNVNGENGKVKNIYDLHGRKLNRAGKGVYIIDGEKFVK